MCLSDSVPVVQKAAEGCLALEIYTGSGQPHAENCSGPPNVMNPIVERMSMIGEIPSNLQNAFVFFVFLIIL